MGHAIIVGAGVAGLASAIALRRIGWTVQVQDRAAGLPEGGTALGMWPEAMRALDRLGVGDRIRSEATLSRGARILDPRGDVIGRVPQSRRAHLISRGRLLSALMSQLSDGDVRWSDPLDLDDTLPDADLVVGADGIHSVVRSRVWSTAAERPLGTVAFRGIVDLPVASVTETWGRGALFGITPTDDGRTNWFACVRRERLGGARNDPLTDLRAVFGTWHAGIVDVLDHLEYDDIDRRDLSDVSFRHPYVQGRVALVGDAAHAMAPNLGRGACESLLDAVALADAIEGRRDVSAGLARYDRERRARTRRTVTAARIINRVATTDRATGLRDRAMILLSSRR